MARSSHLNVMFSRAEKVKFLNLFFPNNFFSSLGKGAKNTHSPHKNHLLFSAREREFTRDTPFPYRFLEKARTNNNDVSAEHARNDFDGCDDVESTGKVVF